MSSDRTLVVVSHYARRPKTQLTQLTEKLRTLASNILVVINDDSAPAESIDTSHGSVPILRRPNTGMNIGGWNAAYNLYPDFDFYIFMQDECEVIRDDFIPAYVAELAKDSVGMTGESINPKWDTDWSAIAHTPLNYILGFDPNGFPVPRVDYYLKCIKNWGISPGANGRHLRSLVWAFNKGALASINGFPIGVNKEECIAAEIAVSKKIEELNLKVTQISERPFTYIHHVEWQRDGRKKSN